MLPDFEVYKSDSNKVLTLQLARNQSDYDDKWQIFSPEMTHQIYGQEETIFGYIGLQIKLTYGAGSLLTYVSIKYDKKLNSNKSGIKIDEPLKPLLEYLPRGYYQDETHFFKSLDQAESKFQPPGDQIYHYSNKGGDFVIYKSGVDTPSLKEYHKRLRTFLLWYVDGASYIDDDDPRWHFYILFQKYRVHNGDIRYAVIGYTTTYSFYSYPDKVRCRISQFLILPPYQRNGHGTKLLEAVYGDLISDKSVADITVEEASDNFVGLRDYVDVKAALKLKCFSKSRFSSGPVTFNEEIVNEIKEKRKMYRRQARKVYEIIRLYYISPNDKKALGRFEKEVKSRLAIPFRKQEQQDKKMAKILSPTELAYMLAMRGTHDVESEINEQYLNVLQSYQFIVNKISSL